ncbi:unnamed protein product [Cuscuta campestris]|uniref:Uncharacterized protein n=1 Tax=Cuscuta campestris TaxID=132261 RepID=A0A484KZ09_9ASTE|nr:unnamed protein product [Cuscuta campestris]
MRCLPPPAESRLCFVHEIQTVNQNWGQQFQFCCLVAQKYVDLELVVPKMNWNWRTHFHSNQFHRNFNSQFNSSSVYQLDPYSFRFVPAIWPGGWERALAS